MKRIVSFLYSITLFTSLNSMEEYLPIPLSKICNCSYKRKDNAIKTLNLDSVPPELIVTYIFPALDTIDCDYELMKLINNYGACYKGQEEQQEKYSNIFSMSIVPLITLSIVNKKLRTNVVIEEIKQRILPFKFTHVSLNSIYKYLKDIIFFRELCFHIVD